MITRNATNERPQQKEPRVTVTKGIRLTGDELTRVRNLLSQYPECASVSFRGAVAQEETAEGSDFRLQAPGFGATHPDLLAARAPSEG